MIAGLHDWKLNSKQRQRENFVVKMDEKKGRCVVALRHFAVDDFVLEYEGDFITKQQKLEKIIEYEVDKEGSYIIDCTWRDKPMAVDGTKFDGTLGRLVNHCKGANLRPFRLLEIHPYLLREVNEGGIPRVALQCVKPILPGEELCWDYCLKPGETEWASNRMNNER